MSTVLDHPHFTESRSLVIRDKLQVGISAFGSWMIGVGTIIGSMAWLFHGPMIARGGPAATVTAWFLAAVLTVPLSLVIAELASMFPSAGGPYVYKYVAFKRLFPRAGELFGFFTGWLFWIALVTGYGCMSNGLVNLLSSTIWGKASESPLWFGPVVIVCLFFGVTALNLLRVRATSRVNAVFTVGKFVLAGAFAWLAFNAPNFEITNVLVTASPAGGNFLSNLSTVLIFAMAAFSGVEFSACVSSETEDARRSVPRAIFLTLASVAAIYLIMSVTVIASSSFVLSPDKTTVVVPGTSIQATCPSLAGYLGGSVWGAAITFGVVFSIIGCGISGLLGCARISYSMAETGLFPRQFASICPSTKVPVFALWVQCICMCLVGVAANMLSRTGFCADAYAFLGEIYGFLYSFLAMLYGVCIISLRKTDPGMDRPFRLGRNGNRLAFLLGGAVIAIYGYLALGCVHMEHQIAGLALILFGLPIHLWARAQHRRRNLDMSEPELSLPPPRR